ncbi:MAG: thioredoxin-dependent peroxiredoxin [Kosmotogales bacterium]|nr:thioredoxin-dependent peroxiredoxin [Kosmotogales bacterium]
MSEIKVGKKAPEFTLPNESDTNISLSDFIGKKVIVYFYPKDNTSGCTLEAENFRDNQMEFEKLNTEILGISKDSTSSHLNFATKLDLNFHLLSDSDETVHKLYDVIKPKKMYGKDYVGTERSTFIVDENGILLKEYRNVKVKGHIQEVFEYIKSLS